MYDNSAVIARWPARDQAPQTLPFVLQLKLKWLLCAKNSSKKVLIHGSKRDKFETYVS